MTKKDYIVFARMFREVLREEDSMEKRDAILKVMRETTDIFQSDNSRFDTERFLNAVYKES